LTILAQSTTFAIRSEGQRKAAFKSSAQIKHGANNEFIREEFNMACCLWWFIAGLVLGWLLHWLFDKFFRRGGSDGGSNYASSYAPPVAPAPTPPAMPSAASLAAAAAGYGFTKLKSPNGYDNFEIIEGIGPKINEVLHNAGVHTFNQLGTMEIPSISKILDAAGPNFKLANPESWSMQSRLCASGNWAELKRVQDELVAGVSMKNDNA
jgi:predicted flap endonuclease-1-like 5' DNA nuclease